MLKFAANLSFLFTEVPFEERFEAAARCGFHAVEYLFPYEHTPQTLKKLLDDNGLTQALFNAPPGDWSKGERGLACLPDRFDEFREGLDQARHYAAVLGNRRIHVMAGVKPDDLDQEEASEAWVNAIRYAADLLGKDGLTVTAEPINRHDMPGYFLSDMEQALALIEQVDRPNVRLQFDIYHCQRMHGDIIWWLSRCWDSIAHIQIANVPGRHEPDRGELNYRFIFEWLWARGYAGFIGCEYIPHGETAAGLGWRDIPEISA